MNNHQFLRLDEEEKLTLDTNFFIELKKRLSSYMIFMQFILQIIIKA